MKQIFLLWAVAACTSACAQKASDVITLTEVERIERTLASDAMQGRKAGTPGSDKAAAFIADEFKKAGLQPLAGNSYLQEFVMVRPQGISTTATVDGKAIDAKNIIAITLQPELSVNQSSGYAGHQIKAGEDFRTRVQEIMAAKQNAVVWVDTSFARLFPRLSGFNRPSFKAATPSANAVFVLSAGQPAAFDIKATNRIEEIKMTNVVGLLPGKSKKDEQVVFSAHYDHLGIGKPVDGDSIYNGANDDAAGTTAVIMLANHYKKAGGNERTLVFAAFTAEEIGGFGSQYFSQQLNPAKVMAMFNIEMIGTESKWGANSAYITGFDKTDMGAILQKALQGSAFTFHPDPYPDQQLFYRSDNATLARLGVPAHTISTSKMDSEPNYHKLSDHVETLDLKNMTQIIKAIATSAATIVAGKDTPARVKTESLR